MGDGTWDHFEQSPHHGYWSWWYICMMNNTRLEKVNMHWSRVTTLGNGHWQHFFFLNMSHIEIIWGNPNLTLGWCQLKQRNREKIALTTGPLKMSRGRFRAPRLIELDSGTISHTTSLRSVGAAPDSNSSALGGPFFFFIWKLSVN